MKIPDRFLSSLFLVTFLVFARPILAAEKSPQNIRPTGVLTTSEVITLTHGQEINYDLGLTSKQEAKVTMEILDPVYVDPPRRPIYRMGNKIVADYNVFSIHADTSFSLSDGDGYKLYKANGSLKQTFGETSLIFDRSTNTAPDGTQVPENKFNAGGSGGRVDTMYIRTTTGRKTTDKLYLKFKSIWAYMITPNHPPLTDNKFIFRVTIEKSPTTWIASQCKSFKGAPKFFYKFLTGGANCAISNDNVSVGNVAAPVASAQTTAVTTIDNTRKNLVISPDKYQGLPVDSVSRKILTQFPDGSFSHARTSSIDLSPPSETAVRATMDGTVTLKVDKTGNGLNTYPYRDKNGHMIPYSDDSGKVYYKCDASQEVGNTICNKPSYGIFAELVNDQSPDKKYKVIYGHLSPTTYEHLKEKTDGKTVTFEVKKGDVIGFSDNTGQSTSSHLHYQVWINGQPALADKSELNNCLSNSKKTAQQVRQEGKSNACWDVLYAYDKANFDLMGIDLDAIN